MSVDYKEQSEFQKESDAVYWYAQILEQRDLDAIFMLGHMYERGFGVPQDYPQAAYFFRIAADEGLEEAEHHLNAMTQNIDFLPMDGDKEVCRYRKKAKTTKITV